MFDSGGFPFNNIRQWYDDFNSPIFPLDCGVLCAPHNPQNIPFCCDICHAVPAVYHQEWAYLRQHTDLWHVWRGDECLTHPEQPEELLVETPSNMLLLACQGARQCQRQYRALSCRQFPFFPYITSDLCFLGFTYEWEYESVCWAISHLEQVTQDYRQEFMSFFERLFANQIEELESYAIRSDQMRQVFAQCRRRIPILHRNGGYYLLSPASERLRRVSADCLPHFGPYTQPR